MKKIKLFGIAAICALLFSCASTNTAAKEEDSLDYLIIVSKKNPIDNDFAKNLELIETDTVYEDEKCQVEKNAYEAYLSLKNALAEKGIEIGIDSAYRSVEYQKQIQRDFLQKYGEEYTRQTVAEPGTSEHHTGLAIDIVPKVDGEWVTENEDMMKLEELFAKIHEELPNHGFILRFPLGKEEISGYAYEPWHIRFVNSVPLAHKLTEKNLTLEEFSQE